MSYLVSDDLEVVAVIMRVETVAEVVVHLVVVPLASLVAEGVVAKPLQHKNLDTAWRGRAYYDIILQ